MNKDAIMVDFLVTILLAIIIFVPACLFVSEFFRVSEQAKGNFLELTKTIQEMKEGDRTTALLIVDDGTALVYFEPEFTEVIVEVDAQLPLTDYTLQVQKPNQCSSKQGCLCLFRGPRYDVSLNTVKITDDSAICRDIEPKLALPNCGIGEAHLVNSYTCSQGFTIERNLAQKSSVWTWGYYESPRRLTLQLSFEQGAIHLQG